MNRIASVTLAFVALLVWPSIALGQEPLFDPAKTVVPITKLKIGVAMGIGVGFVHGTGFCLDPNCRYIVTNYHVAASTGSKIKIRGEKVVETHYYSGPADAVATWNELLDSDADPMLYNQARDLALFRLEHPLGNRGMKGIDFTLDEPERGELVDIYAYPSADQLNLKDRLATFAARFMYRAPSGLLEFSLESSEPITPGASGGLILDHATHHAVGIVIGVTPGNVNVAMAVSIRSLADFIGRVKPKLRAELFPASDELIEAPRALLNIYPLYVPPPNQSESLQGRQEEPAEIKTLREKAQELTEDIKDFIAVQTVEYGGMHFPPAPTVYEVRVVDGQQRFRAYPNGTKELLELPLPYASTIVGPGGEWSYLPKLVATELNLKIVQAPDAIVNHQRVKVFRYYGALEDHACGFKFISDWVLFQRVKTGPTACSGEVWTDADFNIVRISDHNYLPRAATFTYDDVVITYALLNKPVEPNRLVPVTVFIQAEYDGRIYWCRGRYTRYRAFTAKARLLQSFPP